MMAQITWVFWFHCTGWQDQSSFIPELEKNLYDMSPFIKIQNKKMAAGFR